MKFISETKVTPELLHETDVNSEFIFKKLCHRLISDMPLDVLHNLIDLEIVDPNSGESKEILRSRKDWTEIKRIQLLLDEGVILYRAKIEL